MSPVHAEALRVLTKPNGPEFAHLTELFKADTPDPEWIRALASDEDWIIVSGDTRISTNPANKKAWHESGLTAFFFGEPWQNINRFKQAEALMHWWPIIADQAKRTPRGYGFRMQKKAKSLVQIFPGLRDR
jgi:hypothetical protein